MLHFVEERPETDPATLVHFAPAIVLSKDEILDACAGLARGAHAPRRRPYPRSVMGGDTVGASRRSSRPMARRSARVVSLLGLEVERQGVDAVAESRRPGSVREDVSEVTSAARAGDLGPNHPVSVVGVLFDDSGVGGALEARPSRSRFELVVRPEQGRSTCSAAEQARVMYVEQRAAPCRLRPLFAQDVVAVRGQLGLPFLFCLLDLRAHLNQPMRLRSSYARSHLNAVVYADVP